MVCMRSPLSLFVGCTAFLVSFLIGVLCGVKPAFSDSPSHGSESKSTPSQSVDAKKPSASSSHKRSSKRTPQDQNSKADSSVRLEKDLKLPKIPVDRIKFQDSVQLKSDSESWDLAGFRVSLTYVQGALDGQAQQPDFDTLGIEVGVGARLDQEWSLMTQFRYVGTFESDLPVGLRFSGLIMSSYHWKGLTWGIGLGVGSIVEARNVRPDSNPNDVNNLVASYTYSETEAPLPQCTGFGPVGAVQMAYWYPWSEITSIGLGVRGDYQRVGCETPTRRVEPDTAKAIMRRQWWTHMGWSVFGGLSWR